jgi:hypothetical protein
LDDSYFPEMSHKNVYYINVKPYIHDLPFETIISRFVESDLGKKMTEKINKSEFETNILKYLNNFSYTYTEKLNEEQELDKIISKQIMIHLQHFFNYSIKNKKTKNKNNNKNNKTRKKN